MFRVLLSLCLLLLFCYQMLVADSAFSGVPNEVDAIWEKHFAHFSETILIIFNIYYIVMVGLMIVSIFGVIFKPACFRNLYAVSLVVGLLGIFIFDWYPMSAFSLVLTSVRWMLAGMLLILIFKYEKNEGVALTGV